MKKKFICFVLTVITVVSCIIALGISSGAVNTTKGGHLPFEDVNEKHWFHDVVEFCYTNGVINGINDYTFGHSVVLTRAQFVTMLANIEGVDLKAYSTDRFRDVRSSHWYYGAVSWAYSEGITSGTSSTEFSPNSPLTREMLAVMMQKYMTLRSYPAPTGINKVLKNYTDKDKISDWAEYGVKYIAAKGLMKGIDEETLDPKGTVTRAQSAQILERFLVLHYFPRRCGTIHDFMSNSCTEPYECRLCGMKTDLPIGHVVDAAFNCGSSTQSKCKICGYWVSASMMPHDFAPATCTKPATCRSCSATRGAPTGEHTWWAATCVNPKMCKVCYATEGKALGHSWKAADCVNPKHCTRWGCDATEGQPISANKQHTWWAATCINPKICKVCYAESGSTDPNNHSWLAADCYDPMKCKNCSATKGKALGHLTDKGMCNRCKFDVTELSKYTLSFVKGTSFPMTFIIYEREGMSYSKEVPFIKITDCDYRLKGYNGKLVIEFTLDGTMLTDFPEKYDSYDKEAGMLCFVLDDRLYEGYIWWGDDPIILPCKKAGDSFTDFVWNSPRFNPCSYNCEVYFNKHAAIRLGD